MSKQSLAVLVTSLVLTATGFLLLVFNVQLIRNRIFAVGLLTSDESSEALISLSLSSIRQEKVLQEKSEAYDSWLEIPAPLYVHVYLFNLTNAQSVAEGSEELQLQEVGPYFYYDNREKVIYEDDGDTITYLPRSLFQFSPERTAEGLSLDDRITTVNIPLAVS